MNYTFSLIILFIGLSGIVAQVVLLRELLVSFYGNELTIGVILANWILSEALGVFLIGKFIDKVRNKINVFIGLQVIFSFALPVVLYLSRTFKTISGIPFGEGVALPLIFFASLIIILPVAFCHGALFSVCSSLTYSIGRMYIWETLGTITGGLILAYLFIPYLNSFQIIFFIAGLNLVIAINFISPKKIKYLALLVLIFAGLFLNKIPDYLEKYSIEKQWRGLKVLDYKNSVYGNVCVTKNAREYTFFYNGIPVITTPFPDRQFVEELGNLPLLFHQAPKDI
ncbi:MAG: hypothetical protein NTW13_00675, partial [Candidatus Omnitrophica bacterium]|nr:hypothetical protein [Candidatus Omnitrophota bacterium]